MSARTRTVPLALTALAVTLGYRAARTAQLTYGTTEVEHTGPLPGDDVVPRPDLSATRATTVDAPPDVVWPWLVQMGQGRGGFYSYDWLENLAGCDIHNADVIVPRWQDLAVGDEVRLAPEVALTVTALDHEQALVLAGVAPGAGDSPDGDDAEPLGPAMPFDFSWAFVLHPLDDGARTRLVVRERYAYREAWAGGVVRPVSWVSFLMTRRMLHGIRERAERLATQPA